MGDFFLFYRLINAKQVHGDSWINDKTASKHDNKFGGLCLMLDGRMRSEQN